MKIDLSRPVRNVTDKYDMFDTTIYAMHTYIYIYIQTETDTQTQTHVLEHKFEKHLLWAKKNPPPFQPKSRILRPNKTPFLINRYKILHIFKISQNHAWKIPLYLDFANSRIPLKKISPFSRKLVRAWYTLWWLVVGVGCGWDVTLVPPQILRCTDRALS